MYQALMEYLETCPYLTGQSFNFDFVSETPTSYSLVIPTNLPLLFNDTVGNSIKQLTFYITSTSYFGEDSTNNISNLNFFSNVAAWFVEQNESKNYPDLGTGKTATLIEATTDGYIQGSTPNVARYQIQCRLLYKERSTNKAPLSF